MGPICSSSQGVCGQTADPLSCVPGADVKGGCTQVSRVSREERETAYNDCMLCVEMIAVVFRVWFLPQTHLHFMFWFDTKGLTYHYDH